MTARLPKTRNHSKKSIRLKRVTALLIAAGCIAGPVLAQTVIIGGINIEVRNYPPIFTADTLILGNTATGNGTLNFSGGLLNVDQSVVGGYSGTITVGNSGIGTLNQSNTSGNSVINITGPQYVTPAPGNFPDPWGGTLFIGRRDNSSGTYTMTSSNANTLALNVQQDIHIGGSFFSTELGGGSGSTCTINCSGSFVQDGGTVTVGGVVYVGIASAAASTYTLNSGTLSAANGLVVGYGSSGNNTFTQNNGTVTAGGSMFVGANGGSNGTYVLNNGTLNSGAETWLGAFGTGTITQIGGAHNAQQMLIGRFSGGDGTYNLIGGTFTVGNGLTDQLVVGHDGAGTVNMNGGTLTVLNNDINTNAFVVGNNAGSIGVFTQSGGNVQGGRSLTIGQNGGTGTYNLNTGSDPTLNVSIISIGFSGTGVFNQQTGTTVTTNEIFIGGDTGTYNLSGGSLSVLGAQGTIVGTFNVGTFNQSGGTHLTSELIVGNQSFARGTYNMSGGTLTVQGDMLVGRGQADVDPGVAGLFRQTGGDVVTNTLWIGGDTRVPLEQHYGRGRYELVDGTVTSQLTLVGTISPGSVLQTGGTFNAGLLIIGRSGSFTAGGSLTEGSTYDLQGGVLNSNGTTVSEFGIATFNHNGGDHNVAGNLVIGAETSFVDPFPGLGRVLEGTYNFSDGTLNVNGTITLGAATDSKGTVNQSGGVATLTGNLIIANGENSVGIYNLTGSGVLNVSGDTVVGRGGAGVFTQNGSDTVHTVSGILYLGGSGTGGETASTIGTYNLMSGQLLTGASFVGQATFGTFNQSGGTHETGFLLLGNCGGCLGSSANGTYNLTAGTLTAGSVTVSGFGHGEFNQSGGNATVTNDLVVGSAPYINGVPTREGIVNFSGGNLTVSGNTTIGKGNSDFVGELGARGTFNQTGGVANLSGDLIVGGFGSVLEGVDFVVHSGTGFYNLTGPGALNVGGALIVAQGSATGVFTQSSGTVTVAGFLTIGEDLGANGTYRLSGGTVTASNTIVGGGFVGNPGSGGVGTFEQTGGTFQTGFLNMGGGGFAQKGTGTYTLTAGNLIVDNNLIMGNNVGGSATFNQTGGSVHVNSGLFGAFIDNGTYTLSGTGTLSVVSNLIMGGVGGVSSNFNQSGTTQVTLGHDLSVAQVAGSTAAYSLTSSGATLTTGRAYVGESGAGTFTQTAGTVSITAPGGSGDLIIGSTASGNGTYNMSGGNLIVRSNSYIGDAGKGTMNLTGNAVVTVTGNTFIGNNGTGANTGTLTIANNSSYTSAGAVPGGITLGQNTGSSGSIVISDAGTLSTNNRLTVGAAGTGSVLQSGTSVVTAGGLRVGESGTGPSTYTMNGGTLNVLNTSGVEGGTRIGLAGTGTFTLNAGTHNTTFMEIGGTNFAQGGGGTGVYNLNGGTLVASGNISINPQGGSSGTLNVAGGALTAPQIINNDKVNFSGGSITANISNNANVNVSGGAARTLTGNLSNNAGGVLTVAAATPFTVSGVLTNAVGASIVAGANITVGQDYNNLAPGSGNTYNRRANVTGAGQILAAGAGAATAQTLSGNVTGANVAGATMNFGNVRAGTTTTLNYAVGNSNNGGPDLRGAIQTSSVLGANITDARLSGSGVTQGTWGPVAAGAASNNLAVSFNASTAGALVNQKVGIVNNFDNTNSQLLNITGSVFRLATGAATPTPLDLGSFRLTTPTASGSLNVKNSAANDGFSEQLGIQSVASTSAQFTATNNLGATRINAQSTVNGAVSVGLGTGLTAGVNNGSVNIQYLSDGTVSGTGTPINSNLQNVAVTATGYNAAVGNATPNGTITLGNFRVGQPGGVAPQSQAIGITNTIAGPFTESLGVASASVNNAAFNLTNAIGSSLVAAGATANNALNIARTGGSAGLNSGTIAIQYTSDGTGTSGLAAINSNAQNITVNATGYNLATGIAAPGGPVTLGNFHVGVGGGGAPQSTGISVTNQAAATFSEQLAVASASVNNAAFTVTNNIGSNLVNGGATFNNALNVSRAGGVAGLNTGTVAIQYASDGANTSGFSAINTNTQQITVNATGYNLAQSSVVGPINLGVRHVGDNGGSITQALSITNIATPGSFTEGLNSSFGVYTGSGGTLNPTFSGSITNLAAGSTSNAMTVTLSTLTAGSVSGNINIRQASNGSISGLGDTQLADQNPAVSGSVTFTVTNLAQAQINNAQPITFGNVRQNAVLTPQTVSVTNSAPVGAFTEGLIGSAAGTTGTGIIATGSFGSPGNSLAPGQTNPGNPPGSGSITVSIDTGSAGAKSGNAVLNFKSDGTAFVGGTVTDLGNTNVAVSGNVFRLATGAATPAPLDLGSFRLTTPTASGSLNVKNSAANDGFSEQLGIQSVSSANAQFTATNNLGSTRINAQSTVNGAVGVGLGTGLIAGVNNGSVNIQYLSDGTVSGTGAPINSNLQNVLVQATGYNTAVGNATPNGTTALGNFRVGQPGGASPQSQGIGITNTIAGPFTESLGVASASVNNAAFNLTNAIGSGLVAAGTTTSNALTIARAGGSAGVNTGTIAIQYTTDGTGTSGLAAINGNLQNNITVSATGYNMANGNATPNGTMALGNFRVGQPGGVAPQSQGIGITNTVAGPFTESLGVASASVNNAAFNLTNTIGSSLVAAGATASNALTVARIGGSAGVNTGTIAIQYTTDGTGTSGLAAINSNLQNNITVSATGYNMANGSATPGGPITLGSFRVGQPGGAAPQNQGIAITNTVAGPFTESLGVASASVNNAAFNLTNAIGGNLVAAGATTNNALNIARTGGSAGLNTGTIAIQYTTDGTGTSGLAAINSNAQNITVNATGFTTAVATVQPATINFGIVHVNQSVTAQSVSVQNTAVVTPGFNDTLKAQISGTTGPFTASGATVSGLTAGGPANTALTVGLNTSTAGVFTGGTAGTATVALTSQNAALADLGLGSQTVNLNAQVNKYANAVFEKLSGAGAITRSGNIFTLDFGTVFQNSGSLASHIDVRNLVGGGPVDLLTGSLNIVDGNDFADLLVASGVSALTGGLDADVSSGDLLSLALNANTLGLGLHQDSITLTWRGSNTSGFSGTDLGVGDVTYTLNVIGTIIAQGTNVPEPGTLLLMTIALAGFGAARRRKTV